MMHDSSSSWKVWRVDDTGNSFLVRDQLTKAQADELVEVMTARGHKQMYWAEHRLEKDHTEEQENG